MMMLITAGVGKMKTEKEWAEQVKGMLKAELKRRGVTYDGLAERLKALGVDETPENIANKISRGKFTAIFMIQCMEAIGCKTLPLSMD